LATADDEPEFVAEQRKRFVSAIAAIRTAGYAPKITHMANSAAIFRFGDCSFDVVRPGIALYGFVDGTQVLADQSLRPAMSLISEIVSLRKLQAGDTVGYGRLHRVDKDATI